MLVEVWVIRTGLRMTLSSVRRKPSPALNIPPEAMEAD
jgi:hypothetical protein